MSGGKPLNFKPLHRNIELFCLKPLNLYVRPILMWNVEPRSETFMCSSGTFMRKSLCEVLSGTFMTTLMNFMWNFGNLTHSVEAFSGTLDPLFVEPGNF